MPRRKSTTAVVEPPIESTQPIPEVLPEINPIETTTTMNQEDSTATITPEPLPTRVIPIERDEFCSSEYVDPFAKLPRIQALRGTTSNTCGYWVSVDQMAAAGWINFDETQIVDYTFEMSGAVEKGILITNPRMLVCPKTPVLAFDHEESEATKSTVIVGRYTADMKDNVNLRNLQFFNVILLDSSNQPLHQIPLSYKAKGANQASFAAHWQQFCSELTACHALANGIPAKPKNYRFYSLGVFCFTATRELAGTQKKGLACKVASHETPTLENWKQYFVGYNPTTKGYIHEALEPGEPLIVPGSVVDVPALPASAS